VKALSVFIAGMFIASSTAFAQEPPVQEVPATPPILNLRPLELNFNGVKYPVKRLSPTIIAKTMAPKTCAIPLLVTHPKGNFTMHVMKAPDVDPKIRVNPPAPACDDVISGRP
jgi:hypothetical protein